MTNLLRRSVHYLPMPHFPVSGLNLNERPTLWSVMTSVLHSMAYGGGSLGNPPEAVGRGLVAKGIEPRAVVAR
jgi:hypothetical protein